MKKIVLTAVAVLGFVVSNAQEVKYGAKLGLNYSNYAGDVEDANGKLGLLVGGFAEIKIADKFAIQPELLFSAQGYKSEESSSNSSREYTEKLNYLNIPVMAKYYATEKLFIEAGPQIGFLLSGKAEFEGSQNFGGTTTTFSGSEDIKDEFNSTDFGLNIGLGFNFTENIGAGLRYTSGLSNIIKDAEDGYKITNNNIALSVSYTF